MALIFHPAHLHVFYNYIMPTECNFGNSTKMTLCESEIRAGYVRNSHRE